MSERSAAAEGSLGGLLTTLVLTFFGGAAVAAAAVVLGFSFGVLPPGRSELADPCAAADVAGLVPEASWRRGGGGLRSASCTAGGDLGSAEYIHFDLRVEKAGPEDRAAAEHERGCAALAGLGAVHRPPGVGDAACAATEDGLLRVSTVLAHVGGVRITVRYATQAKDAAATERDAIEAARRVAGRLES
ncbi:hypothetical protein [uncultured Thermomonospora sp.]|uniref:hypothetical protein n=1 Tax=uncultured Thermomonospora sp. TaxID=671175 RepID=UPI00259B7835|nr:hypothetical protein [uncultured Thermomonospora sp.]